MTLKNNRAPLLCCFQLCAWFHCHMWIQTGVRVRKRLSCVLTSVTLTFDLWPWPFAWTSLLTMVITPENFMMIRWWEHGEKGVTDRRTDRQTDRQTDGRTDWTSHIAAWSQLKIGHQWCFQKTTVLIDTFKVTEFWWMISSMRTIWYRLGWHAEYWIQKYVNILIDHPVIYDHLHRYRKAIVVWEDLYGRGTRMLLLIHCFRQHLT